MTWATKLAERREQREAERAKNIAALCQPSQSLHRGTYTATSATSPIPKHDYIRSKALMEAYRLIPCQHCGKDDGTVCGAHANTLGMHKGMGIKADDYCASLCFTCHGELDQGAIMGKHERYALWRIAHHKTIRELQARGLWPKDVPLPGQGDNEAFARAQYGSDYIPPK